MRLSTLLLVCCLAAAGYGWMQRDQERASVQSKLGGESAAHPQPPLAAPASRKHEPIASRVESVEFAPDHPGAILVSKQRGWRPLLIVMDPSGNALGGVRQWELAAEKYPWHVAASALEKNGKGATERAPKILSTLWGYMSMKYQVDQHRVMLAGFSGSGVRAYWQALLRPERYAGAIVQCGHAGAWRDAFNGRTDARSALLLYTRDEDFNRAATEAMYAQMRTQRSLTAHFLMEPGSHEHHASRRLDVRPTGKARAHARGVMAVAMDGRS